MESLGSAIVSTATGKVSGEFTKKEHSKRSGAATIQRDSCWPDKEQRFGVTLCVIKQKVI